jgi:S-formylglutathione hydrolase FrmB
VTLTYGWLPILLQILSAAVLVYAIGWRSRRWRAVWVPVAAGVGIALTALVYWYIAFQGWSQDPAPLVLWIWITLTGLSAVLAAVGWGGISWLRRGASVAAVFLCVFCSALSVNMWVGYFPTAQSAWDRLTGAEPARWVDLQTVKDMQARGERPTEGVVVKVQTPTISGFAHRQELVYLPPAWFASNPPPKLPAVLMFGGEFGHPDDWLRLANGLNTLDEFTARHRGNAPVMVFPDAGGQFSNDTECVNGPRGNAADHITKNVVPYVVSNFGVSAEPANWGIVGWSSGGTCALMLSVLHPELFSAFIDVDGQLGPNAGTREQTIARLFGGDADQWAAFDPKTIIAQRGHYDDMAAWFAVSTDTPTVYRSGKDQSNAAPSINWDTASEDHAVTANALCSLVSNHGIECAVVSTHGSHDIPGAGKAFAAALPWLAGRLGTPGVKPVSLPGAPAK